MRKAGLVVALLAGATSGCAAPGPDDPPTDDVTTDLPCGRADFALAPAPRSEPGFGLLAPIDIESLTADVQVDVDRERLVVRASLTFVGPPAEALSVFQLLPGPDELVLDGEALPPDSLIPTVVSTPPRRLVVLPDPLEPCSEHELELAYAVPASALADAPLPALEFGGGTAWWSSAQEDGIPDAMLERVLPSNLLFDRHPIDLTVELVGAKAPHNLVGNGDIAEAGQDRWTATFPSRQPHGSFWALYPTAGVDTLRRDVALPGGRVVEVTLYGFAADVDVDLERSADVAEATLLEYDAELGPYLHGDRYLAWLRTDMSVSMEYEGATLSTPAALQHEIAHSWYARGIAPVSEFHGWMDEGMATWVTGENPYFAAEMPTGVAGVRLLVGEDAWSGASLNFVHYLQGSLVYAGIAWEVGPEALLAALRGFQAEYAPGPVTTEDLERHLYCALGDPFVLDIVHSRVRGLEGWPETPGSDICSEFP